jgi:kynurenine formamidase
VEYRFSQDPPITEEAAVALAADMGFHAIAYDYEDVDEPLHWHEFDSVTWVIDGNGAFADEHGNVTTVTSGCRLEAPAGWLHRSLAGGVGRVVVSTNLPGEQWTSPINKDPADRPEHLQV